MSWTPPPTLDDLYAKTAGNRFQSINSDTAGARFDRALPVADVAVNLYSLGTPNGQKVSILLEELGVTYAAHTVDIQSGDQFSSGFVAVNPNSKIPCVVYKGQRVFESGAILVYLADALSHGKLIPKLDDPKRAECLSWVFWQMAGQGPMSGNFGHFFRYAPRDKVEALEYGVARYGMEVRRLLSVLDRHLADGRTWILGDDYSVADVACYPWVETIDTGYGAGGFIGTTKGRYPHLDKWVARMRARPAVRRGMCVLAGKKKAKELADMSASAAKAFTDASESESVQPGARAKM